MFLLHKGQSFSALHITSPASSLKVHKVMGWASLEKPLLRLGKRMFWGDIVAFQYMKKAYEKVGETF